MLAPRQSAMQEQQFSQSRDDASCETATKYAVMHAMQLRALRAICKGVRDARVGFRFQTATCRESSFSRRQWSLVWPDLRKACLWKKPMCLGLGLEQAREMSGWLQVPLPPNGSLGISPGEVGSTLAEGDRLMGFTF
tara:strand:- start:30 stop:440 length:411 start_codon:yes stop_codon:yes gene_type:complete